MQSKGKYYITTAIAYTSGKPHIGNTYEIIMADSIARWKRADGYDVHFQTGSDEHGQKIEERARRVGETPKQFVDECAGEIRRIWDRVNTSYDRFIRTTDEDHERQVQKIFKKLYDQGDIYLGQYSGMYCTECEAFYTPSQLVDGDKCPVCGGTCHQENENAYFFKMQKYAPRLIEHIRQHPEFIQPESRKNEMLNNFLLPGLQDLCVSRTSFKWGIPVDFDPDHVVYVWLDALSNYITGPGYDAEGNSSDLYKKYWPADLHLIGKDIVRFHTIYWPIFLMALGEPLPRQVFGHPWLLQGGEKMSKTKGNVIYADDMADIFGVDAVRYFVLHEMPYESDGIITWELCIERINSDLANTLGNLVKRTISMSNKYFGGVVADRGAAEPVDEDLKAVVTGAYARVEEDMDELRIADAMKEIFAVFKRLNKYIDETQPWVLARDPEKKDRLATVLYNLTEGILMGTSLLAPFMPETGDKIAAQLNTQLRDFDTMGTFGLYPSGTKVTEHPEILFARLDEKEVMAKVAVVVEKQKAEAAAAAARGDIGDAKKEGAASDQKAAEHNNDQAGASGTTAGNGAAVDGQALTAGAVGNGAAAGGSAVPAGSGGNAPSDGGTEAGSEGSAPSGTGTADGLSAPSADGPQEEPPVHKNEITIDEFARMELRVGVIEKCEVVPKSKKLLCSQVRIGTEVRQIVSGIRKYYSPEEMVGKKVMVICNLKPAKLAGFLSEGMLLCSVDADGNLALMTPDPEKEMPAGAEIR